MRRNGLSAFWQKKQYVIAGALIVAAAIGMTALYSRSQAKEREELEKEIAREMEQEHAADVAKEEDTEKKDAEAASSVVKPKESEKEEKAEVEKETEESEEPETEVAQEEPPVQQETKDVGTVEPTLHFAADEGILWPMEGNVIINYSMDSSVYFATLDHYRYNPGIVISGDVNSKVYAAAKGKIVGIEDDDITGTTLTLDLGDGYQAVYGQLKELNFGVGDYVEAGHVLGYVSEPTKYFSVEGSNLYFEMRKDGVPIDPIEFFE